MLHWSHVQLYWRFSSYPQVITDPALIQLQYIGSANNLHNLNDGFIILLCCYIIDREYSTERDPILSSLLSSHWIHSAPPPLLSSPLVFFFLCVACKACLPLLTKIREISDKKLTTEDGIDGTNGYFMEQKTLWITFQTFPGERKQLRIPFCGTKIEATLAIPFRTLPWRRKELEIPFCGTKIEANSRNAVSNHSMEEKTTQYKTRQPKICTLWRIFATL